jgi:hypothetical protein
MRYLFKAVGGILLVLAGFEIAFRDSVAKILKALEGPIRGVC